MDNVDSKLKSIFNSTTFKISEKYIDTVNLTLEKLQNKKRKVYSKFKISFATICCSILLITGIVYAKEIKYTIQKYLEENFNTAIEHGYISKPEMNLIENEFIIKEKNIVETFVTNIKIENIIMTDSNINILFYMELDDEVNKYIKFTEKNENGMINYENSYNIQLPEVIIIDENDNLIYCTDIDEDNFNKLKSKYKLKFDYEYYKNIYAETSNVKEILLKKNIIGVNLLYKANTTEKFMNSKELKIYINNINLIPKNINDKQLTLQGNWEIKTDIPEVMYNRENIFYEVVENENENFEVYEAKATPIGFELGIKIKHCTQPEIPKELINPKDNTVYMFSTREKLLEVFKNSSFEKIYEEYYTKLYPISVSGVSLISWLPKTEGCYILNENGEKFFHTSTPNDNYNFKYENTEENNYFDFYRGFKMTSYDATNKITVVIDYCREPVEIKLEKIK